MPDTDNPKGDNYGSGLPKELFGSIDAQLGGGGAKGTPAEQLSVYRALALEENAALNPGAGTTSMADAMLKYFFIAQAADDLTNAGTGPAVTQAINKLVPAIQALGKQWHDFGPVRSEFIASVKKT